MSVLKISQLKPIKQKKKKTQEMLTKMSQFEHFFVCFLFESGLSLNLKSTVVLIANNPASK